MFHFAVLLALVAVSCCSAYDHEVSDALRAYVASQEHAGAGREFYFPCDGVHAKEMESLDLNRYGGQWYSTNMAFSSSHKYDTDKIQRELSEYSGCASSNITATSPNALVIEQRAGLRKAVNKTATVPGWTVVENGKALRRAMNVSLPRAGDNGKWKQRVDLGNSTTVIIDTLIVATDYSKTGMWYSCQDIPVPFTADTVREQRWGLMRRKPRNFNELELAALKLVALSRGIMDSDRLYTIPTDGC